MRRPPEERSEQGRGAGDPPRWTQAPGGSALERSLASGVRALPEPNELDDLRLAQIRHHILNQEPSGRGPLIAGWSWARTAAFALAFLLLGGLTTAMAARLYIRRLERTTVGPVETGAAALGARVREKPRRWRMAMRQPAELEVSSGPDGTEIAVVDGRAELSGAELASPLTLTPGSPWSPGSGKLPPASAKAALPVTPGQDEAVREDSSAADRVVPRSPARRPVRLALATPRPASPPPAPPSSSPAPPLADPPATASPLEPLPFPAPPVVPDGRAKTAVALAPRPPAAAPEGPAEAFLVAGALRSLRAEHAPRDALIKLDEHRRRFPHGALGREAALARVEALLGLGRNDEARTILDSLTLGSTGADRQARLARAELRADRGDCVGAVDDLDGILTGPKNDEVAARALYRRARCALRTRNSEGARVDLRAYQARFPDGPRRLEVEALLRRLGG